MEIEYFLFLQKAQKAVNDYDKMETKFNENFWFEKNLNANIKNMNHLLGEK